MNMNEKEFLAMLRLYFAAFVERCFYELNPGAVFSPHWSVDLLAAILDSCRTGETRRLIINLPPRHLKSIIASVALPAFLLGHDPAAQILCVSYSQDLSEKFSRDCRTIMSSAWYRRLFPRTRLSPTRQAANDFETTAHGFRKATSVGGVITGRGADFIIIDDPLKPEDAMSKSQREGTNEWYSHTLFSRLNDKKLGRVIIIMQRLHEDDLVGYLLAQGGGWDLLSLPAIAEADEVHTIKSVFGDERVTRRQGEALHPERESLATLETIRQSLGSAVFAAQYQQAPTPPAGLMAKLSWFKRYKQGDLPTRFDQIVMSCDTANKVSELSDYSVFTIWGAKNKNYYLLHVLRRKMNYPDLKRTIKETAEQFRVTTILIEDRASGTQLIQELISEGFDSVKGCSPDGDKVMRFHAQTGTIENGFVWLPEEAHWLADYLHEITAFPNSKHDDQVDSTAQALAWFKIPNSAEVWIAYYKHLAEVAWGIEPPSVRMLAPIGISHVQTLSGKSVAVPNDRIILLTERDAAPLVAAGFKRLD